MIVVKENNKWNILGLTDQELEDIDGALAFVVGSEAITNLGVCIENAGHIPSKEYYDMYDANIEVRTKGSVSAEVDVALVKRR